MRYRYSRTSKYGHWELEVFDEVRDGWRKCEKFTEFNLEDADTTARNMAEWYSKLHIKHEIDS